MLIIIIWEKKYPLNRFSQIFFAKKKLIKKNRCVFLNFTHFYAPIPQVIDFFYEIPVENILNKKLL